MVILIIIIAGALLWAIFVYNRLIVLKNDVKSAWHQIDVQLKRRYDLIPNLVSTVRGYMDFEKETLERVVAARARAMTVVPIRERAAAEEVLTLALGGLFALVESYPTLKSNENVMELQEELVSTENRIAFARQFYNDLVANFRTRIQAFPDVIISSVFSFRSPEFFSADPVDRSVPRV